jgi:hypothetical protein
LDPIQGRNVDSVVYIDDIRLSNAGQPIQVEALSEGTGTAPQVTQADLRAVIEAAQRGWTGLIDTPDWITGVTLGSSGVSTTKLPMVKVHNVENDRNTGGGEGGLNDQGFFAGLSDSSVFQVGSYESTGCAGGGSLRNRLSDGASVADQVGSDGNTSLPTNSHSVQSQDDSLLLQRKNVVLINVVVNEDIALHPEITDSGALIDGLAVPISITDFDLRRDFASQGSDGAITELEVLKLEELSLQSFETISRLGRLGEGFIEPRFFTGVAPGLGQDEDQQNQNMLQHNLSFGTLTLPPDRNLVNNSEAVSCQLSSLSFDQLALLNQATITIADLADGYLALTLGATITLDTDAAGYGWFIDQKPFLNEEFVSGASSLVKREASEANDEIRATNDASRWQFFATPDSAVAGQMDLLTVLRHEHGYK